MDERLITQSLQEQARKDIPEDMNLIPEVTEKVGRVSRAAARSRLSWVAAAVLGMLAVSVVAYAAARLLQEPSFDPGLRGASEAELVTELNLTQTMGDVTVTLAYAYADVNRISFAYRMSGEAPIGTSYEFSGERLTDSAGHEFQSMFGGGGGGGGGGGEAPIVHEFTMEQFGSYDVSMLDDLPDDLDLRLEVDVDQVVGATLGEGGTPQPVESGPARTPIGPFVFEFTIPLIRGQEIAPEQSASDGETMLTLERLVIAPSMTRALMCFDPPLAQAYAPALSLTIDGETVVLESATRLEGAPEDSAEGCYGVQVLQSFYGLSGEWRLSVDHLIERLPIGSYGFGSDGTTVDYSIVVADEEILAQVRDKLATALEPYGIEVVETDANLAFSYPATADIDQATIEQIVTDATTERIGGPWAFSFEVPPAS